MGGTSNCWSEEGEEKEEVPTTPRLRTTGARKAEPSFNGKRRVVGQGGIDQAGAEGQNKSAIWGGANVVGLTCDEKRGGLKKEGVEVKG